MAKNAKIARTRAQNRKFSALVGEVARACPLIPYRRAFFVEAWRRFFIAAYVHEARREAFLAGRPDPFPVRPVPSSELTSEQASELISFCDAWCAENNVASRE